MQIKRMVKSYLSWIRVGLEPKAAPGFKGSLPLWQGKQLSVLLRLLREYVFRGQPAPWPFFLHDGSCFLGPAPTQAGFHFLSAPR